MMQRKLVSIMLGGLLLSGLAFANHHEGTMHGEGMHEDKMPSMFSQIDSNKDGRISQAESQEGATRMFNEADTNKDGFISKEEMLAHHKTMHEKQAGLMRERWKAADKDGDGALSRAEVDAGNMPMLARDFDKLDKNKDGKLAPDEIRAGMPKREPRK